MPQSELEVLRLDDTQVSAACLQTVKQFPLRRLYLHNLSRITDKGLKDVATIETLKELTLHTAPIAKISDKGIREFKALPELERLSLANPTTS